MRTSEEMNSTHGYETGNQFSTFFKKKKNHEEKNQFLTFAAFTSNSLLFFLLPVTAHTFDGLFFAKHTTNCISGRPFERLHGILLRCKHSLPSQR